MSYLDVRDLKTYLYTRAGVVKAVDGVSFSVNKGETLGLVGESGCGKTMTCLSLLRLLPQPAGRIVSGQILLDGADLVPKSEKEMQQIRGEKISMILQDPMTALNPVLTIGDQLMEGIRNHKPVRGDGLRTRAVERLKLVRIPSPEERLHHWPHQLSGGMRQRVVTAIALSGDPGLLVADEPTTSLDATIQVQVLRLLRDLQQQIGLTLVFITHDFGVVARMCNRVAVMYAGRIVEMAPVRELFNHPAHPYTAALMQAVPRVETKVDRLVSIEGQPPRLVDLPPGCAFAPRCKFVRPDCRDTSPQLVQIGVDHWSSCQQT